MIRMPSDSFKGPLPPFTEEERRLEQELRIYGQQLAGQIGERNLFQYEQLVAAAMYNRSILTSADYDGRRHTRQGRVYSHGRVVSERKKVFGGSGSRLIVVN